MNQPDTLYGLPPNPHRSALFQEGSEQRYEGLISSLRHSRNRLLFFVLFAVYNLLAILGTTDKMLFMGQGVEMPLLNIELPLLAFYVSMPVFLVALQFNLLFTYRKHREFLLEAERDDPVLVKKALPWGLYESALLERRSVVGMVVYGSMMALLYLLAPLVLFAFWFRFADYQSLLITNLHLFLLLASVLTPIFFFRGLFRNEKTIQPFKVSTKILIFLFLYGGVYYHITVIIPITQKNVDLKQLTLLSREWKKIEWFLPRIILQGELLVEADKNLLEMVRETEEKNSQELEPLLYYLPPKNYSRRNFRLAELVSCVLPRANFSQAKLQQSNLQDSELQEANFENAKLQQANLENTELQNVNFHKAKLQESNLHRAELQDANLNKAQLQRASLHSAELQGADLSEAQLQDTNFYRAQLQEADLSEAQLQGANLYFTWLKRANLVDAQLQGANLDSAQLRKASLRSAQLQGASLRSVGLQGAFLHEAQLQGVDLRGAQLQGAYLYKTQLQGANLCYAQLQGTDLRFTQLQGIQTADKEIQTALSKRIPIILFRNTCNINFQNSKGKKADFSGLNPKKIDPKTAEILQEKLEYYIEEAIDYSSLEWIEMQIAELPEDQKPQIGILTEEMFNEIAASVTEPKARERMGLPPLEAK